MGLGSSFECYSFKIVRESKHMLSSYQDTKEKYDFSRKGTVRKIFLGGMSEDRTLKACG